MKTCQVLKTTYEPHAYTHQVDPPYTAYPGLFYGEQVDRATLDAWLAPVDAFQAEHNVPIVVGEWGGIRWLPGIEQYIADQLSLFEERGWSWFWYAWDDEEWDELGFELQMGPDRDSLAYDPQTPAFRPIVEGWQAALGAIPAKQEGATRPAASRPRLADVSHWLYLIDVNLERETVEQIAASEYDMSAKTRPSWPNPTNIWQPLTPSPRSRSGSTAEPITTRQATAPCLAPTPR